MSPTRYNYIKKHVKFLKHAYNGCIHPLDSDNIWEMKEEILKIKYEELQYIDTTLEEIMILTCNIDNLLKTTDGEYWS